MQSLIVFLVGVLTLAAIYASLAMVLNLVAGWAGMWDLGVAGLVAVAAYTFIILTQTRVDTGLLFTPGWPMAVGIIGAVVVTGLAALLIALPSIRLRGEYFLITTLAFAEVIHQLAISESGLTRGTTGFSSIDRPFKDLVPASDYRWLLLAVAIVVMTAVYLLLNRMSKAPFVRLLRASRDNEAVAQSLGKNVVRYRLITYVLAGALIGVITPLYLWHVRSVVPSLFVSELTFVVWTALVIGGMASRKGPIIGAALLITCTELLTFLQGSAEYAQLLAATRPVILGLLLILVLRFRPEGLMSERSAFRFSGKTLDSFVAPKEKVVTAK
ncbi:MULTISPECIES: branched-chain amino acid ABC transporter permease [Mycobacteriaceae]|uniref:branched-chain amino acid ABC transporter permease n=1 Tax=Mycobacteriaceae TaxID=1762 RepID=UPI000801C14E|nr:MULTISPECIES: branched-chain amino acid ABC transporter permease [Mycobacteriaceae]MCK0176295.1 branched-chain amino acid ABC transporter permease [Mycolicibacterium sp. F2034L]OBB61682.1 ABC transporter permease [Mycobacterium sp. 852013-51886_SCH5428379]